MLPGCLATLKWCQQIIIVDSGSTDQTLEVAAQFHAQVIQNHEASFAQKRNAGLAVASQPYVLYIDADERVTPLLAQEIAVNIETKAAPTLILPRKNIFFGRSMAHGGWQHDNLPRVFEKNHITAWVGEVHESPQTLGEAKVLHNYLLHFSHRSVHDGLIKTVDWTAIEAKLLFQAHTSKVSFMTVLRKMTAELLRRLLIKQGFKDGEVGMMEGLIQAINKGLIYLQLWDLQNKSKFSDSYQEEENKIRVLWENES